MKNSSQVVDAMPPIIEHLAQEIRQIYHQDQGGARASIEDYLNRQLQGLDHAVKLQLISSLVESFSPPPEPQPVAETRLQQEFLLRFCTLVLGKALSPAEISSTETLNRLSQSLNTIFDNLNQLVHDIRITLFLETAQDETIRHVIGSSLSQESPSASLEHYLGEIKSAFFVSYQAFKAAAEKTVTRILHELDPEQPAIAGHTDFMFGVMRKAHSYDRYQQIFKNCQQWHDAGHSIEVFLQEFEKECQRLSQHPRR